MAAHDAAKHTVQPSLRRSAPACARHAPQRTLLHALVQAHCPDFLAQLAAQARLLPACVREAFEAYLRFGVLEHDFLCVVCDHCHAERRVALSCKQRGFRRSFGARRMPKSARHLVEDVFGARPARQWALNFPYPLRFLSARKRDAIKRTLAIVQRLIGGWRADKVDIEPASAKCSAATLAQRFGSALNLNIHPDVHARTNAATH